MKKIKIAINGFGRIGRLVLRSILERDLINDFDLVAVNDIMPIDNLTYLLKYDSIHGRLKEEVKITAEDQIEITTKSGKNFSFKALSYKSHPSELPWKDFGVDIIIESTGLFTKPNDANGHLSAGAKKVIISAPSDENVRTIIIGINGNEYKGENIISNASCTTNCLAPLVYVLLKSGIGVSEGIMTTAHAYTASQLTVDGPSRKAFRDGRSAATNIIPASTGAAKAIGLVIPEVKGRITGMAFRVPVQNVSVVDFTFKPNRPTSLKEINEAIKTASESYLKGILGYTTDPIVSSDILHDPRSSIYDATASIELNSEFFKLISWYDNEWGYSNRLVDLLYLLAKFI